MPAEIKNNGKTIGHIVVEMTEERKYQPLVVTAGNTVLIPKDDAADNYQTHHHDLAMLTSATEVWMIPENVDSADRLMVHPADVLSLRPLVNVELDANLPHPLIMRLTNPDSYAYRHVLLPAVRRAVGKEVAELLRSHPGRIQVGDKLAAQITAAGHPPPPQVIHKPWVPINIHGQRVHRPEMTVARHPIRLHDYRHHRAMSNISLARALIQHTAYTPVIEEREELHTNSPIAILSAVSVITAGEVTPGELIESDTLADLITLHVTIYGPDGIRELRVPADYFAGNKYTLGGHLAKADVILVAQESVGDPDEFIRDVISDLEPNLDQNELRRCRASLANMLHDPEKASQSVLSELAQQSAQAIEQNPEARLLPGTEGRSGSIVVRYDK
ncbi:MAG: hypothetical protein OXC95_18665 [Dehalococcoidia bacterium]|nr:hypothetical protein [Dehalococcoidia bacterium]